LIEFYGLRSAAKECFQIFAMQEFFMLNYLGFAERRIYNQKQTIPFPRREIAWLNVSIRVAVVQKKSGCPMSFRDGSWD